MQRERLRKGTVGGIEIEQHPPAFLGRQRNQIMHGFCGGQFKCLRQTGQDGLYAVAHQLRIDPGHRLDIQFEPLPPVIDRQRQRIVGALIFLEQFDTLPVQRPGAITMVFTASVIQQGAEQRCARGNPAATLCQRQRCMLMSEQVGHPRRSIAHTGGNALGTQRQAQRQGIDEQSQRMFATRTVHAPQQHTAEHHVCPSREHRQHPSPRQVKQAGDTDTEPPCLRAQTVSHQRWYGLDYFNGRSVIASLCHTER